MKTKLILIVGAVVVVGGIVLLSLRSSHPESTDQTAGMDSGSAVGMTEEEKQVVADQKAAVSTTTAEQRYASAKYGFSFNKPAGYTVGALNDGTGDTLLVQPATAGSNSGFQIYITPIDEPTTITPNLIKSQLPGTSVNNAQNIVLDGKGKGLMFASNNEAFGGSSFEIWFVYPNKAGGNLYQITSYGSFAAQLQAIIGTWKFQ